MPLLLRQLTQLLLAAAVASATTAAASFRTYDFSELGLSFYNDLC
jgi:hypothetical protein